MRVLVADDEAPARRRLIRQLADIPAVEVVGEAADGEEALAQVGALSPDLVLLDIRMPVLDGLSLAERYAKLPPIIFITAYDEFAVRAFEVNAVDYLLKPVRQERLEAAIDRARARSTKTKDEGRVADLLSSLLERAAPTQAARVTTFERGAILFFDAKEIARFWSEEKYTSFLVEGEERLTKEPLNALEERLQSAGFMRVHRGELVNLHRVRSLQATETGYDLILSDGQTARVSRRYVPALKKALGLAEED